MQKLLIIRSCISIISVQLSCTFEITRINELTFDIFFVKIHVVCCKISCSLLSVYYQYQLAI